MQGERRIAMRPMVLGHEAACACHLAYARWRFASDGTLKARRTRREPQRGHLSRLSNLASGKSRPRVQTNVHRSNSAPYTHSLIRFMASRGPQRRNDQDLYDRVSRTGMTPKHTPWKLVSIRLGSLDPITAR
jgi:hypothetical protein